MIVSGYYSELITNLLPSQSDPYFFNNLDRALNTHSNGDRVLLVDDFNIEISVVMYRATWCTSHPKLRK